MNFPVPVYTQRHTDAPEPCERQHSPASQYFAVDLGDRDRGIPRALQASQPGLPRVNSKIPCLKVECEDQHTNTQTHTQCIHTYALYTHTKLLNSFRNKGRNGVGKACDLGGCSNCVKGASKDD